jgi:homoserine kinase
MSSMTTENAPISASRNGLFTSGDRLHLRLPATSANLGPGFDTAALALTLALTIDATRMPAGASEFSLKATGRNTDICSSLRRNLMLDVYQKTLAANGSDLAYLSLDIHNEIPIGMGFGSSAAVRLAGVAIANHFGNLGWSREQILTEASRLEGHPDNAAACWLGGFTVAATDGGQVRAVSIVPPASWRVLLAMPEKPLATVAARSVLPTTYSREDAVFNIQRVGLMTAAFASGRGDLLSTAIQDRMHQPFRGEICPLLPSLLPLGGASGVLGVALSGAGPSVLLLVDEDAAMDEVRALVTRSLAEPVELLECDIEHSPAVVESTVLWTRD